MSTFPKPRPCSMCGGTRFHTVCLKGRSSGKILRRECAECGRVSFVRKRPAVAPAAERAPR